MRSSAMTEGAIRAPHRSLLRALGLNKDDMKGPFIAIANSASDMVPGHIHLKQIAQVVKEGIRQAGGVPLEFSTTAICDGLAMDHKGMRFSLPSRELICDTCELTLNAMPMDGIVFISNCDKVTPGMLMAMGKLNIPALLVSGGPMLAGNYKGRKVDLISVFEAVGRYKNGTLSEEELESLESCACPGAGSCAGLFTANSMNALAEALGIALRGNGTVPAVSMERTRLAREAGQRIMELVNQQLTPRQIVTADSFYNAVLVDLAVGGSTNTVLHLPAIAHAFGIPFELDIFDKLSRKVPHICHLSPIGQDHIEDLDRAGGIYAVMNLLLKASLLKDNAMTIYRQGIGTLVAGVEVTDTEVIRPLERPYHAEGGIAILYGNLAPQGAVIKQAGTAQAMRRHRGPAIVFEDGEQATQAILDQRIKAGDVVVIRYEGPKGGPGMREMLSPTSALVGMDLIDKVALITDGRFSGGSTGAVIGHVSPEAAEGGPIAIVKDGDIIEIDLDQRRLELSLTEPEINERLKNIQPFSRDLEDDILKRYAYFVQSANTGARFRNP